MKLTFEKGKLLQLIKDIEEGSGHRASFAGDDYDQELDGTPGIILAGSEGVGLHGNHEGAIGTGVGVVWANECNPEKMSINECFHTKLNTFGSGDGGFFVPLHVVKENMLDFSVPYIDFTPFGIYYGSAQPEDLSEAPDSESQAIIEIDYIDELVEADCEESDDEEENDYEKEREYYNFEEEEPLSSWRHYRAYAQVPLDFAVKEMKIDPDEYDDRKYHLQVDIYMNPQNLWAKVELENYGELCPNQMHYTQMRYKNRPLRGIAVEDMLTWHAGEQQDLNENSYQITCEFNPERLPDHLGREGFQKVFREALAEISPNSTLSFKAGDYYRLKGYGYYDDAYLQFLVYRWIMNNRPELESHRWLTIHLGEPNNCFNELISAYYGWPDCEVHGWM